LRFDRADDCLLIVSIPRAFCGVAAGEAPVGLHSTGNASHCVLWTSTHVPCMTLPLFSGPNGLPVGAQLIAARNHDRLLFDASRWVLAKYL